MCKIKIIAFCFGLLCLASGLSAVEAQFAQGYQHSLYLSADGTVYATGRNTKGQLGDGTTTNRTTWVKVDLSGVSGEVIDIQAGYEFSMIVTSSAYVYCWGDNAYGQCAEPVDTAYYTTPRVIGLGFNRIAAGEKFALAITASGTVYGWGDNRYGQIGNGNPSPTPVTSYSAISSSFFDNKDVVEVSAGADFSLARTANGEVYSWGRGLYGRLGIGGSEDESRPVLIDTIGNIKRISAGAYHSMALSTIGEVLVWGYNNDGQLGLDNTASAYIPEPVPEITFATDISAGRYHSTVLRYNGFVYTCGRDLNGQLGNGSESTSDQLSYGSYVTTNVSRLPRNLYYGSGAIKGDARLYAWGYNTYKQLGTDLTESTISTPSLATAQWSNDIITKVASGAFNSFALKQDGILWSWGANSLGQVGDQTTVERDTPVTSYTIWDTKHISKRSSGNSHSLVAHTGGYMYGFGDNDSAQLGLGHSSPSSYSTRQSVGYKYPIDIAVGANHSLYLSANGRVYAVGANKSGQLGNNSTTDSTAFVLVKYKLLFSYLTLENIKQIAAGIDTSYALDGRGQVWAWGEGSYSGMGDGSTTDNIYASLVQKDTGGSLDNIIAITAGGYHAMALDANGEVWTWGTNSLGRTGHNTETGSTVQATRITATMDAIVKIDCSEYHSMALDYKGRVWTWGLDTDGQLMNGALGQQNIPNQVFTGAAYDISAGQRHSLILTASGEVKAGGRDSSGQLGEELGSGDQQDAINTLPVWLPEISIAAFDSTAAETGETGYIRLTRSFPVTGSFRYYGQTMVNLDPDAGVAMGVDFSSIVDDDPIAPGLQVAILPGATYRNVTITAIDDFIDEDNETVTIKVLVGDGYRLQTTTSADVVITDDDTRDIVLTDSAGLTTTESGGKDTFQIRLATQPTASVTIPVKSLDIGEGKVSLDNAVFSEQVNVLFTTGDWNVNKTIYVQGQDDFIDDGNQNWYIDPLPMVSSDLKYNGYDYSSGAIINTDNDNTGFYRIEMAGNTSETGSTQTFQISLQSQPTSDVTMTFTSSNTAEAKVHTNGGDTPAASCQYVFTSVNWNTYKAITVTGQDDDVDDGTVAYSISVSLSTSDPTYSSASTADFLSNNDDDDTAGITVTKDDSIVDEHQADVDMHITLTSKPLFNVTIQFASDDTTEIMPTSTSVTFTPSDWNITQDIPIDIIDDDIVDGSEIVKINFTGASSSDGNYSGLIATSQTFGVKDNDALGVTFGTASAATEGGSTGSYTVELDSEPVGGDVTVTITGDSQADPNPSFLTFTSGTWNIPQPVTIIAIDDDSVEGSHSSTITHSFSGADYDTYADENQIVSITDNDSAGVVVNKASITTSEDGTTDSFIVTLTALPTDDVTIPISISGDEATLSGVTSVVITPALWEIGVLVTVTGLDDVIIDGAQAYTVVLGATTSTDTNFVLTDGATPDVTGSNTDNDSASVLISKTVLTTAEPNGTDSFTVMLGTQPSDDVVIPLTIGGDTDEIILDGGSVTLNSGNWNTGVSVTVTGQNDDVVDGVRNYSVVLGDPSSTSDTYYDALTGTATPDLSGTNADDDSIGVTISKTSTTATEAGGTDTYSVVLNSQPTSAVTITVTALSQVQVNAASSVDLTFNPSGGSLWNTAQMITISAINDDVDELSPHYATISHTASGGDYSGASIDDILVSITDDDSADIVLSGSASTTEAGGTASYSLVLASQPSDNVMIGISSSDLSEGTVSTSSMTFTSLDWNIAQTITATGVNDFIDDGDQTFTIVTSLAVSSDPLYSGLNPNDKTVTNTDDDSKGVTVGTISGNTSEAGGQATFTLVLTSEPTSDVTIAVPTLDATEGTASPASVIFTPSRWNEVKTITVSGVDDNIDDGDIAYTIETNVSGADYTGVTATDVSVTNTDDDTKGVTVSKTTCVTTETGGTDSFSVVLNSKPANSVTITVASSNVSYGTVSTALLTFTTGDWNVAQTVTITGVDDGASATGDHAYTVTLGDTSSTDGNYNGLTVTNVSVTNTDNDVAGITITPISQNTTEAGGTATFTISLNTTPSSGTVTIPLSSSDTTEGTISETGINLSNTTPYVVTVTGVNDDIDDGDTAYSIVIGTTTATDGNYNSLNPADVSVTNTDDDTKGFTLVETDLTTSEAGATGSFTLALNSEPTSTVTIDVTALDTTETTFTTQQLSFTSGTWNIAQTITLTGKNDDVDDGDIAYVIQTAAAAGGDYAGMNPADVTLVNTDDDTAAITVVSAPLTTNESGSTDTFTIKLASQPTNTVTISLVSSDETEATVSPTTIEFTNLNWNAVRTVTVTGVDDSVDESPDNQAYSINMSSSSLDSIYNGMSITSIAGVNVDNDTKGVTVSKTTCTTTELGGQDNFSVVLNSKPSASVSISLTGVDSSEGTIDKASLTFTPADWYIEQVVTITGVDDLILDAGTNYTILLGDTVGPADYAGLSVADVTVTNVDNDAAGFTVSPISNSTTEAGGTATFTIVLNTAPTDSVTVPVSSNDTTEGTLSVSSVVFSTGDWNVEQEITVTGVDDDSDDGDISYSIVTGLASSTDSNYVLNPSDISVINTDNDTVGVSLSSISGNTNEGAGTATFSVSLSSKPTGNVVIDCATTDSTEGTINKSTLTFTTVDWNVAQVVTVTGVNDAEADGNITYYITAVINQSSTDDNAYDVLVLTPVEVVNVDNDVVGVTVSSISGNTGEDGTTASFTVRLNTQPTANVTIAAISSDNTNEGTVSVSLPLTFTTSTWNDPQTVIVTGVNDDVDDDDVTYAIVLGATTSGDGNYNGLTPDSVTVINTDDDEAGITVNNSSWGDTSESGTSKTFTLVLNSKPTGDVSIPVSSSDTTEGTISPPVCTFTTANWDTAQTVTVTGVDDVFKDGDISYTVNLLLSSSADANYRDIDLNDLLLKNTDNDTESFIIVESDSSTSVNEEGTTSDTFTLALSSQPSADTVITIAHGDGQITPISAMFTFTSANWNIPQEVTVTAVDDSLLDAVSTATVTITADAVYGSITDSVSVTVVDDDNAEAVVTPTTGLVVNEAGTVTDTFTVALGAPPATGKKVYITLSANGTLVSLSAATLTFTPSDWSTAQTVTVTGVDNYVDNTDAAFSVSLSVDNTQADSDPAFAAMSLSAVSGINTDNDTAGITVDSTIVTDEDGGYALLVVSLDTQPTGNVQIDISSSDTTEGQRDISTHTFTTSNWTLPKIIKINGQDDNILDGTIPYTATVGVNDGNTPDTNYTTKPDIVVSLQNEDNDTPIVTITESTSTDVVENGATDSYTVSLNVEPLSNVTVTIVPDSQIVVDAVSNQLVFTAGNWSTPQTVTVTAVDDLIAEGIHSASITHVASGAGFNRATIDPITVTVTDDDTASVIQTALSPATVVENNGTATYTIKLGTNPTSNVTITLASNDETEASVSPKTLTFTPANWNTVQTVTVTGIDDDEEDGAVAFAIAASAISGDSNYSGMTIADINGTTTDDDTKGIAISTTTLTVSESGTSSGFTVNLESQPTAEVRIPVSTADVNEVSLNLSELTFNETNWAQEQWVFVTGENDAVQDGAQAVIIALAAAESTDTNYSGVDASDVTVTNEDDDIADVDITQTDGYTSAVEGGASDSIVLTLETEPTADVIIAVTVDAQITATPSSVTFTPANWSTAQEVTIAAVDDVITEGNHDGNFGFTVTGAAEYAGMSLSGGTVIVADNDSAGIVITPTSVTEGDVTQQSFSVELSSQPISDIIVELSWNTLGQITSVASPQSFTFTTANWNVGQNITFTVADDAIAEELVEIPVYARVTTGDGTYDDIDANEIAITITDNDTRSVIVNQTAWSKTEGGDSAIYTLVLGSEPTEDVTVTVVADNQSSISPSELVFTSVNYSQPQLVTINVIDDAIAEGTHSSTVSHSAAGSSYESVNINNVVVTITDNDVLGIFVSPNTNLQTDETGGSVVCSVTLTSQPSGDVSLAIASSNELFGTVTPASLSFTESNWNTAQQITIIGQDVAGSGDNAYSVTLTPSSVEDAQYNALTATTLSLTNIDDDVESLLVVHSSGSTAISESGTTDSYGLVLSQQPTGDVTVSLTVDSTQLTASPTTLTYTSSNWNVAQTVSLTAVDDSIDEGDVYSVVINHTCANGGYDAVAAVDVAVAVTDDDTMGVLFNPLTVTVAEGGVDQTVDVRLTSQPAADVIVVLTSVQLPDQSSKQLVLKDEVSTAIGSGNLDAVSLTFTNANWNVAQTITAQAVDDVDVDGKMQFVLAALFANSTDTDYKALANAYFSGYVEDNESFDIVVSPTYKIETTEMGGTVSFAISLTQAVPETVRIPLYNTNALQGTLSVSEVNFAANDTSEKIVTITGLKDVNHGDEEYYVIVQAAESANVNYDGQEGDAVLVVNKAANNAPEITNPGQQTIVENAGIQQIALSGISTGQSGENDSITITAVSQNTGLISNPVIIYDGSSSTATLQYTAVTEQSGTATIQLTVTDNGSTPQDLTDDASTQTSFDIVVTAVNNAPTVTTNTGFTYVDASNDFRVLPSETKTLHATQLQLNATDVDSSDADLRYNIILPPSRGRLLLSGTSLGVNDYFTNQHIRDGVVAYEQNGVLSSTDDAFAFVVSDGNRGDVGVSESVLAVFPIQVVGLLTGTTATTEGAAAQALPITLATVPLADVTISLTPSNQLTTDVTSLVLNSGSMSGTVQLSAIDDAIAEASHSGTISYTLTSADAKYNGLTVTASSHAITDNDTAGVSIVGAPATVEGGASGSYTVVLTSEPTGTVSLNLTADGQETVSPSLLSFTTANWSTAQTVTVTAVDDEKAEGAHVGSVTTFVTGGGYDGMTVPSVSVAITDNDTPGLQISPTTLEVSETGSTGSFAVILGSQPSADVVINLTSSDTGEVTVGTSSLTFTSQNWATVQEVTVTGVDDVDQDGDQIATITLTVSSIDAAYGGTTGTVTVTNVDDDQAAIIVTHTDGGTLVTEAGATDTYEVRLGSAPTADVTVSLSNGDGQVSFSPASLTFTSGNYNTEQTITVTAIDDNLDEALTHTGSITHTASSSDTDYNTITSAATVSLTDNDESGLIVTPGGGIVTIENGPSATIAIALSSIPSADVTVSLAVSDASEGSLNVTSLSFNTTNWSVPQNINILSVDDPDTDGNQIYSIDCTFAASIDPSYKILPTRSISVLNQDDESSGVLVTPLTGLETDENGATASFTVRLNTAPANDVTIDVQSSRIDQGLVDIPQLTFTSSNWNVLQTVTITGQLDSTHGDQPYQITLKNTISSDVNYSNLSVPAVQVVNKAGNNAPSVNAPVTQNLSEDAGAQSLTISGISTGQTNENDSLTITATSSNPGLVPDPTVVYSSPASTAILNYQPVAQQAGSTTITITVTDDGGTPGNLADDKTTNALFVVSVAQVNDAPVIAGTNVLTVSAGTGKILTTAMLSVSDEDHATTDISYVVVLEPTLGELEGPGGALSINGTFTPAEIAAGHITYTHGSNDKVGLSDGFAVKAVDAGGAESVLKAFVITIDRTAPQTFPTGAAVSYTENAASSLIDPTVDLVKGTELTFKALTASLTSNGTSADVLSIRSAGDISFDGSTLSYQNTPIGTAASDGTGGSDLIINLNTSATETATELALQALTYENTSEAPSGLDRTVTVTITDPANKSDSFTQVITVIPVNDAPVVTARTYSTAMSVDLNSTISFADPDSLVDNFVVVTSPSRGTLSTINPATGGFTYTPNTGASGTDQFVVKAIDVDGALESSEITMTVVITSLDLTTRPIVISDAPMSATVGTELNYTLLVETSNLPANPSLEYAVLNKIGDMAISTSGTFTWTPVTGDVSKHHPISITITNGTEVGIHSFLVTVDVVAAQ